MLSCEAVDVCRGKKPEEISRMPRDDRRTSTLGKRDWVLSLHLARRSSRVGSRVDFTHKSER